MLSMRRCCPAKTLFTFVRVELISFLPFTDCRAHGSGAALTEMGASVKSLLQSEGKIQSSDVKPWTFMSVTGTYVDVNPLLLPYQCVCLWMCTMKWVAEREPPSITAVNGRPDVLLEPRMRSVLLGGEGQRLSDGTVWLRSAQHWCDCVGPRWMQHCWGLGSWFLLWMAKVKIRHLRRNVTDVAWRAG